MRNVSKVLTSLSLCAMLSLYRAHLHPPGSLARQGGLLLHLRKPLLLQRRQPLLRPGVTCRNQTFIDFRFRRSWRTLKSGSQAHF